MANGTVWNIVVDDIPYVIELKGNKIKVNNNEPIKYTKLNKAVNEGKGANYEVPVGNKTAILRINTYSSPVLTLDGKDCSTGLPYEAPELPWWVWIHIVIHAMGMVFFVGGAIGGAIQGAVIIVLMNVASNKNKSTLCRVAICTAILFVSYIIQFCIRTFVLVNL